MTCCSARAATTCCWVTQPRTSSTAVRTEMSAGAGPARTPSSSARPSKLVHRDSSSTSERERPSLHTPNPSKPVAPFERPVDQTHARLEVVAAYRARNSGCRSSSPAGRPRPSTHPVRARARRGIGRPERRRRASPSRSPAGRGARRQPRRRADNATPRPRWPSPPATGSGASTNRAPRSGTASTAATRTRPRAPTQHPGIAPSRSRGLRLPRAPTPVIGSVPRTLVRRRLNPCSKLCSGRGASSMPTATSPAASTTRHRPGSRPSPSRRSRRSTRAPRR